MGYVYGCLGIFLRERIGYMRELVKCRIGRIYPKGEVEGHGYKAEVKVKEK